MFHILVLGNAAMLTRRDRDDLFYYTEGVRQIDYLYTIYTGQGLGKKKQKGRKDNSTICIFYLHGHVFRF